jgi:hypothetical protein
MKWLNILCVVTNALAAAMYWLLYAHDGRGLNLAAAALFTFAALTWVAITVMNVRTAAYRRETERLYPKSVQR